MEGQPSTGNSQYQYQSAQWSRLVRRNTHADSNSSSSPSISGLPQLPTQFIPILLPQQPLFHQQQLAQYNRLISSGRNNSLQTAPLPPLLSAQHIQAVPGQRSSSSGVTTERKHKPAARGGHGNRDVRKYSKGERALITEKETSATMSGKKFELTAQLPPRPVPQHQNSTLSRESNSVPSTPHQHARNFSFESREPSPSAPGSHSPRSAYSESNITLPSRPPPAPRRGCPYETAMAFTKRRMAYSLGTDRLEQLKDSDIKSKLSDDEEKKLSTDMRELYDRLLPTAETDERRRKLVLKLEDMFNKEWPGHDIRVHVFGSSGNLLCTDESDVDICITTDWKAMEGVCMIAELLAKNGMQKVICVSTAKVPIVKIFDPDLKLFCDMNVNNTLALENTRMIKTYIEIDPRVRPLAMIIKHWTKSRVINDAAFGGTLSSYTWICMIVNFLQSREPPVLPALHQRPHLKLPTKEGGESSFADDVDALKEFGLKNKSTLGELLFQFFRFYGHEFDYDKQVVSVRSGKQISKQEKGWSISTNNMLCVEEPFNVGRNLGNTADDFSFRGLHMEMRRAFDLISVGKLDECCEKFQFPKEEERVWEKPPPSKKPTLTASHPPHRSGRGGHRGGRNNHSNRNSSGGSRRSSNSNYDHQIYQQHGMPSNISTQEQWVQQQAQAQLHNHLYTTYSVLQAQENTLRMQLMQQSYAEQAHAQAQAQAYAQSHARMQSGGMPIKQQPSDRNRPSLFEQGPLTAPIRPEGMYFYPLQYAGQPMYAYPTSNTNPSSPQLSAVTPELRRSMHRSTVTNGSNSNMIQSNGSVRSHSQPGTRTSPSPVLLQGAGHPALGANGLGAYQPSRQQISRVPIPNFISDEATEQVYESRRTATTPPELSTPKEYVGYYVNEPQNTSSRKDIPLTIPSFGDLSGNRRRLSTDQLPQSIHDRIKRNPSRSPSPLGNDRHFSLAQSTPAQHTMSSSNLRILNNHGPLVVNGSSTGGPSLTHQTTAANVGSVSGDRFYRTTGSVGSISQASATESDISLGEGLSGQLTPRDSRNAPNGISPLVVNGSSANLPATNGAISYQPASTNGPSIADSLDGSSRLSPSSRNKPARQNGGMSPLDIGGSHNDLIPNGFNHLSPVYESHTPSPTINRKLENLKFNGPAVSEKTNSEHPKTSSKHSVGTEQPAKQFTSNLKQNGHTRAAKSEGSGFGVSSGSWQKPKGKKGRSPPEAKTANGGNAHGEKLPVNESERKGG
ncbi:bc0980f6-ef4f-4edf-b4f7-6eda8336feb4 [Sclerotinia trifoliorum]|uniref:polynucleotide adenylyltransferase n=1 Tax=Sclerotinia trifoliorum TaxID=28548 RepID=A0A8H2VSU5_9HELO|nr:bc0980f6-ef4f-4edf-b4f7-6eda8336feb4 [Sclerotinia trifoliorum]